MARRRIGKTKCEGLIMRLTVIGCSDAFGSGGRFNTCFMVQGTKSTVLLDCGASTPVALKVRGVDFNSIDGIVLSHLHGDHFGAIPFLMLESQFHLRRERPQGRPAGGMAGVRLDDTAVTNLYVGPRILYTWGTALTLEGTVGTSYSIQQASDPAGLWNIVGTLVLTIAVREGHSTTGLVERIRQGRSALDP